MRSTEATTEIVEKDGSKLVCVRLNKTLRHEDEYWFMGCLQKMHGVAYLEFNQDTKRLAGYGVWEPWWEEFRFRLEVSLMTSAERE